MSDDPSAKSGITSHTLTIDSTADAPLYWQIYTNLRSVILTGRLEQGRQLPSSRALASELGISRTTVLRAYDQLLAEGYVEGFKAKGTFVASVIPAPEQSYPEPHLEARAVSTNSSMSARLSDMGQRIVHSPRATLADFAMPQGGAFSAGVPALDAFPIKLWAKLVSRHVRQLGETSLAYQDAAGYLPLRQAISDHLTLTRRVRSLPEQIIIVSGSQGALHLVSRLLLNPGDEVWLEDPGYLGARGAFLGVGATLVPVPVDAEGLDVAEGIKRSPTAKLAYLTPSHQFPLGVNMSLARRLAILEWATQAESYLFEDDYDSEYRFGGRPLAALQGLDKAGRVIYCGTFSKTLFPALRIGYLVLPENLVDVFLAARQFVDVHTPLLEQLALTDFLTEGHYGRHLRRMRKLYGQRRAALLGALKPLPLDVYASEMGMHCVAWLPKGMSDQFVAERAAVHKVDVTPLSKFRLESLKPEVWQGLMLGYACADETEIRQATTRLATALKESGT